MAEVRRAAGAGAGDVARAAEPPLASIATSARAAPTLSMPLSSSNAAAIACYAEPIVNDAEIVPSPLRRRLENDPWARTLGIEFLDVRRGHCSPSATPITHGQLPGVSARRRDLLAGRRRLRRRVQLARRRAVALSVTINYLAVVTSEAVLVAEAHEVKQGRRRGAPSPAPTPW